MEASVAMVASPRGRLIREMLLETVAAYHYQWMRKFHKGLSYTGELSSAGHDGEGVMSSATATLYKPTEDKLSWEEDFIVDLVQLDTNRGKNIPILMSDTNGGHRASVEAIKDAFRIEFGDDY